MVKVTHFLFFSNSLLHELIGATMGDAPVTMDLGVTLAVALLTP